MNIRLAVLPGDGVGPEVTSVGLAALRELLDPSRHEIETTEWPIGWASMAAGGDPLPAETLTACLDADAILLGAVGDPEADHLPPAERPVSGLLRLRRELGCYANLRPVRVSDGLLESSAVRPELARDVDLLIVRELAGGLYYGEPRGLDPGRRVAINTLRYERHEVERVARMAFDLATARGGHVTSIDKANVLETSRLWRSVLDEVGAEYPGTPLDHMLVDRTALEIVSNPRRFDTIVTTNIFGDVLSDAAGALVGSLGPLGSASLGGTTDLYEPVHGSAPDIAGRGVVNPMGMLASVSLMLRHSFGLDDEACALDAAVDRVLADGLRTRDLGGPAACTTKDFEEAVLTAIGHMTAQEA